MTGGSMKRLRDLSYNKFAKSIPLYYNGPIVKIEIGDAEYKVSKALLCEYSPYFHSIFNGKFKEGREQSAVLADVDGVVSTRGFELLLQWLYLGRIVWDKEEAPGERISAAIEFARLEDMLGVLNVDSQIADHMRTTILNNPAPIPPGYDASNANVYHITSQHVYSAARLPKGHGVRVLLAKAAIVGYLCSKRFKFSEEIQEVPEFAADILVTMRPTIKGIKDVIFKDPFTGARYSLLVKKNIGWE